MPKSAPQLLQYPWNPFQSIFSGKKGKKKTKNKKPLQFIKILPILKSALQLCSQNMNEVHTQNKKQFCSKKQLDNNLPRKYEQPLKLCFHQHAAKFTLHAPGGQDFYVILICLWVFWELQIVNRKFWRLLTGPCQYENEKNYKMKFKRN